MQRFGNVLVGVSQVDGRHLPGMPLLYRVNPSSDEDLQRYRRRLRLPPRTWA